VNRFNRLQVRTKLWLLAGIAVAALLGLGGLQILTLHSVNADNTALLDKELNGQRRLLQAQPALGNAGRFEKNLFLRMADAQQLNTERQRWRQAMTAAGSALDQAAAVLTPAEVLTLQRMRAGMAGHDQGMSDTQQAIVLPLRAFEPALAALAALRDGELGARVQGEAQGDMARLAAALDATVAEPSQAAAQEIGTLAVTSVGRAAQGGTLLTEKLPSIRRNPDAIDEASFATC
jgi:hypothetical protein